MLSLIQNTFQPLMQKASARGTTKRIGLETNARRKRTRVKVSALSGS